MTLLGGSARISDPLDVCLGVDAEKIIDPRGAHVELLHMSV